MGEYVHWKTKGHSQLVTGSGSTSAEVVSASCLSCKPFILCPSVHPPLFHPAFIFHLFSDRENCTHPLGILTDLWCWRKRENWQGSLRRWLSRRVAGLQDSICTQNFGCPGLCAKTIFSVKVMSWQGNRLPPTPPSTATPVVPYATSKLQHATGKTCSSLVIQCALIEMTETALNTRILSVTIDAVHFYHV